MTAPSIIVQQPAAPAERLVLLMHGVGATPQSLLGVAEWFARRDAGAMVVSVAAPEASDISAGRQWFSVRGVTEDNRQARVDAALPGFAATVCHWQQAAGVTPAHILIAGFSQGAIMALEATKLPETIAARIVALAGRYATLPTAAPTAAIHLLHGDADPVMPVALARAADARLQQLGADATLDVVPGIGHEPHPALLTQLAGRLVSS